MCFFFVGAVQELPLTGLLPRGFHPGWQLEIYGRVKILPHAFYINLQEGSHLWPHPVIPLHLNPRFSKYEYIYVDLFKKRVACYLLWPPFRCCVAWLMALWWGLLGGTAPLTFFISPLHCVVMFYTSRSTMLLPGEY